MADRMNVANVATLIHETSTELERLLAQLSVEQMNQPGVVGVWSVKDVLAHLAYWQRYVVAILRAIACGETPILEGDDETERNNASAVAQYYQRSLAATIADWHAAREDLLDQLEQISDDDLNDSERFAWSNGRTLLDRIAGSSYDHEQEHIEQIREWMRKF
jgi:uncharacterized protein (TIGR03083 family)